MNLVRFTREDFSIYLWWSILDAKLAVSCIINLVVDISTDTKREIIPNTLGFPYLFLFIY